MIDAKDITTYARQLFSRSRGQQTPQIMHANREWFLIVAIFFILFAFSVAFSVWQYRWYQELPNTIIAADETVVPNYSWELVQSVLQERQTSRERFYELLVGSIDQEVNGSDSSDEEQVMEAPATDAPIDEGLVPSATTIINTVPIEDETAVTEPEEADSDDDIPIPVLD